MLRSILCVLVLASAVAAQPKKEKPSPFHPRSLPEVRKAIAVIEAAHPADKGDDLAKDRDLTLRRLKIYRYLAELPYEKLTYDKEWDKRCQAAADLCLRTDSLDHRPVQPPGMPAAAFKLAYDGCYNSNLAKAESLAAALDMHLDDSDPSNIKHLGHRRWLLNPPLAKTGAGVAKNYSAIYAWDTSATRPFDYQVICHPARGYMPVEYFSHRRAWSVTVNPLRFSQPNPKVAKVAIYEADAKGKPVGKPLPLDFEHVDLGLAGPPNCIIFRPEQIDLGPGKRYLVEVVGLQSGGRYVPLVYLVEFFELTEPQSQPN